MLPLTFVLLFLTNTNLLAWASPCVTLISTTGTRQVNCSISPSNFITAWIEAHGLTFQCVQATPDVYSMFDDLTIGPTKYIKFRQCPFPSIPFLNFTQQIQAEGFISLSFESFMNQSDSLLADHFRGLSNLTELRLISNGFTEIPPHLFEGLSNLTSLELRDNYFTLPPGVFDDIPQLTNLDLGNNKMTSLPSDVFRNLNKLTNLYLWGNRLKNLSKEQFYNLTSLELLDLQSSGLQVLHEEVFRDSGALKILNISKNKFSTLPYGLFTSTPSLEVFRMTDNLNSITLPSQLFSNLPKLEVVYLMRNKLQSLPEDIFEGSAALVNLSMNANEFVELPKLLLKDQKNLLFLDLSQNSLQHLPDGFFSSLKSLKTLYLRDNRLTTISGLLFRGLNQLRELDLSNNELSWINKSAFSDLIDIQIADLSNNNLTFSYNSSFHDDYYSFGNESPFHNSGKLEKLSLANNSISEIFSDWKLVCLQLKELDLKYNAFTKLEVHDIHFLASSLTVDLRYNSINEVDLVSLTAFAETQGDRKPTTILLDGNPLECDCMATELYKFSVGNYSNKVYDFVNFKVDNLMCSAPAMLKGQKLDKLSATDFVCSVHYCPDLCDCWIRGYDKVIAINCTARGLTEIPLQLPLQLESRAKYLILILEDNKIQRLPDRMPSGYSKVIELYLSGNKLEDVNPNLLSSNITQLTLDNNNITHLSKEMLNFLSKSDSLKLLTLHKNPWHCDCSTRDFLSFLQLKYKQISFLQNVNCSDGRTISKLSVGDLCPAPLALVLGCAVLAACGILVGATAALYYRYNHAVRVWLYARGWCLWLVTEEELDRDKRFDAFVSFSQKDEDFVVNTLVPGLENCGLKLCLHYRDWVAGEWIPTQIARSVEASRRTLVVLSPNFLDSVWGRLEFRAAHKQALSEGRARVVMLLFGDLPPPNELDPELRAYISVNTYVKWGDQWFWDKLRYALPHAPLPSKIGRKKQIDDNLELINPLESPVNSPSTPPALPFTPNVVIGRSILQTPSECILPVAS